MWHSGMFVHLCVCSCVCVYMLGSVQSNHIESYVRYTHCVLTKPSSRQANSAIRHGTTESAACACVVRNGGDAPNPSNWRSTLRVRSCAWKLSNTYSGMWKWAHIMRRSCWANFARKLHNIVRMRMNSGEVRGYSTTDGELVKWSDVMCVCMHVCKIVHICQWEACACVWMFEVSSSV